MCKRSLKKKKNIGISLSFKELVSSGQEKKKLLDLYGSDTEPEHENVHNHEHQHGENCNHEH